MDTGLAQPIEITWSHILVGPLPAGRLVSLVGISEIVKSSPVAQCTVDLPCDAEGFGLSWLCACSVTRDRQSLGIDRLV